MTFEVTPHKLVYGGEALAHAQGRTVLVARGLPGERMEVETVRDAKGVIHARPLRIIEPSPERVEPPCPYFGRCGGCHYQHLAPPSQVSWKTEILRETLRRIGTISWDAPIEVHAGEPWNYRNQAEFKIAHGADSAVELGFFEGESHRLCPVDACLILSPRLNSILHALREPQWLSRLGDFQTLDLLVDDKDEKVRLTLRGAAHDFAHTHQIAQDLLQGIAGVTGVSIASATKLETFGEPALAYRVGEFAYRVSSGSFFQASRFLLPGLVTSVLGEESGAVALDLFAGVGLFTLPLARRYQQVIGVEASPEAARDLEANLRAHSLANARASGQSVFDFLRRFALPLPDLIVLDPPRAGAEKRVLERLAQIGPRRIRYVSCHPPALARDLAYLLGHGYRLESVAMFDFFPQTYHVESLARLMKAD
jgi:23S rRNA (uracil1939-C5)-methyltransferase